MEKPAPRKRKPAFACLERAMESEKFVSGGKRGRQIRPVRKDGWTARKREIFLDHYAAAGNAAEACRAAGMAEGAAYRLRRRDPEFAQQYDESHAISKIRLEEMVIEYAKTQGRMKAVEPGELPPVDMATFNPELALRVLHHPRPSANGNASRVGARARRASKEELTAALLKLLDALDRRIARGEL